MNYLIGTSMQLDIRIIALFFSIVLSSCLHWQGTPSDQLLEINIVNDTSKNLEIVLFPPDWHPPILFADTLTILPFEEFKGKETGGGDSPFYYDSVHIFLGGEYQRTDVNFRDERVIAPSFFSAFSGDDWVRYNCGKNCDGIRIKTSLLLPEVLE